MVNASTPEIRSTRWMWLRWSWRDLRSRWVAVLAIAMVMAIGVGVYAGLGSTSAWRTESNDASFAALEMHDIRVALSPGTFTSEGALIAGAREIEAADVIVGLSERLVLDSQIDATTTAESILVAARIVGMDLDPGSPVDRLWLSDGTLPDSRGAEPAGVLEMKFADHWELPEQGTVTVAGNRPVRYEGIGLLAEDFFYEGPEGSILSEGELAPLYVSLAHAQDLSDRQNQVNDLVVRIAPETDAAVVERQLRVMVDRLGIGASVTTREDAQAFRVLYDDIENDQRLWNALAGLVLVAAALAAFNLISRIVEAQRREIGIGMALGVPRHQLAIRPMLVGLQVAVLGTLLGIVVGIIMGEAMGNLIRSFLPLPIWRTTFQFDVFAKAAILGLAVPVIAAIVPVWRALRVEPIEAIRTGHLNAKSNRLTDWTRHIHLPGSTLAQIPLRNVLRTPRRTILTAVGIGAAITALIAVLGLLDSFGRTIDQIGDEFNQSHPDRVLVQLDTFHPIASPITAQLATEPTIGDIDVGLRLPLVATTTDPNENLDLLVELIDLDSATWTPTLTETTAAPNTGITLARKAAHDLGIDVGGMISLVHPVRYEDGSFGITRSDVAVSAIHTNPLRSFAYMDLSSADLFGLSGQTNFLHAYPAAGASSADLQRTVFDMPGVSSSQAVSRISASFRDVLDQFTGLLTITALAVLFLAVLIAFNATRITVEERQREHATMRAFGLPVRSIVAVVVKESVITGVVATLVGIGGGLIFLRWMLGSLASTTLPDLGFTRYLSPTTIIVATIVGVVAVAIAPLFLARRISRMDISDSLRVME